jgi:hypothetical protein
MINVDSSRAEKTRRWRIADKFINDDFTNFLLNAFPLELNAIEVDRTHLTGFGSIQEYANHFQLQDLHGITLDAIIKLLDDKDCILEISRKENRLQYHHQNIEYLRVEIMARIKN